MELTDLYNSIPWLGNHGGTIQHWRLVLSSTGQPDLELTSGEMVALPEWHVSSKLYTLPNLRRVLDGKWLVQVRAEQVPAFVRTARRQNERIAGSLRIESGTDPEGASALILNSYLVEYLEQHGVCVLTFKVCYPNADRSVCRPLSSVGSAFIESVDWIPLVFGSAEYTLLPLFQTDTARLDQPLHLVDHVLTLNRAVDWPVPGYVQVNDEVIRYTIISEDGLQLGTEAHPLQRPMPRLHSRNARTVYISTEEPRWVVADHEAQLLEVRAENHNGPPLTEHVVSAGDLAGRIATTLQRQALPLVISHSSHADVSETERSAWYWQILEGSNAYNSLDAFTDQEPQIGAILTRDRHTIHASFSQPALSSEERFDRIETAELVIEYTDSPGWGIDTRLRVEIAYDGASVTGLYNRQGFLVDIPVAVEARFPQTLKGAPTTRTEIVDFEKCIASAGWSEPHATIDHVFTRVAQSPAGKATLILGFHRSFERFAGRAIAIAFIVAVENPAASSHNIGIAIDLPGTLYHSSAVSIDPGAQQDVRLDVALPSNVELTDLSSGNFRVTVDGPGGLSIREAWLELSLEETPSSTPALGIDTLSLTATMQSRIPYNRISVDVSELLPAENRQDFFSGEISPIVKITLISAPSIPLWQVAVRNVHWARTVYRATSVRPVDRIWAKVRGLHAREDGTANPAECVYSLFTHSNFGHVPEESLDPHDLNQCVHACNERGLSFGAVFRTGALLGELIEHALGEGMLIAVPIGGDWRLTVQPGSMDSIKAPALGDHYQVQGEKRIEATIPGEIYSDAMPAGWNWIVGDGATLRHSLLHWRRFGVESRVLAANVSLMNLMPGVAAAIGAPGDTALRYQGELASIHFADAMLNWTFERGEAVRVALEGEGGSVLRNETTGDVIFLSGDRILARLYTNGDLSIRGVLVEEAEDSPQLGAVLSGAAVAGGVWFIFQSGQSRAAALVTAEGNLNTSVPFAEALAIADPASAAVAEMRAEASLLGGFPGQPAAMKLTLDRLSIRGRLRQQIQL